MTTQQAAVINMDMSLDEIEDLPGFITFPSGAYRVTLKEGFEEKKINEHPAIEMAMTLEEILELTDPVPEEEQPKIGDVCTSSFMLDNKFGAGNLKEVLRPISAALGVSKLGEIVAGSKGLQLMVVIKRTYDKEKDRHYANVKQVQVL